LRRYDEGSGWFDDDDRLGTASGRRVAPIDLEPPEDDLGRRRGCTTRGSAATVVRLRR
jgi:hypothetical protein